MDKQAIDALGAGADVCTFFFVFFVCVVHFFFSFLRCSFDCHIGTINFVKQLAAQLFIQRLLLIEPEHPLSTNIYFESYSLLIVIILLVFFFCHFPLHYILFFFSCLVSVSLFNYSFIDNFHRVHSITFIRFKEAKQFLYVCVYFFF